MRRILRYFGYVSVSDLSAASLRFDDEHTKIKNAILAKRPATRDNFLDALEEGYQAIGALRFVGEFINETSC